MAEWWNGRMMGNGGSAAPRRFPGIDPRHVTCASRFRSVTVFIAIFTSWFRQRGGGVLSRVRCKTGCERAATSEIFTLQFGHVITPDIPQPAPTDAPRVQSVYAVYPLVWFPPEYFTPMTRRPLLHEFFDKSSVSNESRKIDARRCQVCTGCLKR